MVFCLLIFFSVERTSFESDAFFFTHFFSPPSLVVFIYLFSSPTPTSFSFNYLLRARMLSCTVDILVIPQQSRSSFCTKSCFWCHCCRSCIALKFEMHLMCNSVNKCSSLTFPNDRPLVHLRDQHPTLTLRPIEFWMIIKEAESDILEMCRSPCRPLQRAAGAPLSQLGFTALDRGLCRWAQCLILCIVFTSLLMFCQ